MNKILSKIGLLFAFVVVFSCNKDEDVTASTSKKEVVENYVNIVFANYQKAFIDAKVLKEAINTFVLNPTNQNFSAAKLAWLTARESYGTTEAFRFADGPIDNDKGPEKFINSWPLDEVFIDYVDGNPNSGIINDDVSFSEITKQVLIKENGNNNNEEYVTVGYHAIEFLLWGQDLTAPAAKLPGQRPYTDYVVGGTAQNQIRRGEYLKVCADLLTDNLGYLVDQWRIGGEYRITFLSLPEDVALKNMYKGFTTLLSGELPVERMEVALGNKSQEDEHSCFSDNTHRDIALNLQGAINVYRGKYGTISGASLESLVQKNNIQVYESTKMLIDQAVNNVNLIDNPFDFAISEGATSVQGAKVKTAAASIKLLAKNLLDGATKMGIIVNK